jgi:hypothetical protein
MGSIIEMAARNELLRRDGHHTAQEFLGRIEGQLLPRPAPEREGDSMPPPTVESEDHKVSPTSWSMLAPQAKVTESSAWIPAVRSVRKEDER